MENAGEDAMAQDTASVFNRALKILLRKASELTGDDQHIIALRRSYIAEKIKNEAGPMIAFWESVGPVRDLVANRDREALHKRFEALHLDALRELSEDTVLPLWQLMDTMIELAERALSPPANAIRALDALEAPSAGDDAKLQEVLAATTKVLPNVFRELGMDVGSAEIQEATKKLTSGPLGGMLRNMMSSQHPEHDVFEA